MTPQTRYLEVFKYAQFTRITLTTVRAAIKERQLDALKVGGQYPIPSLMYEELKSARRGALPMGMCIVISRIDLLTTSEIQRIDLRARHIYRGLASLIAWDDAEKATRSGFYRRAMRLIPLDGSLSRGVDPTGRTLGWLNCRYSKRRRGWCPGARSGRVKSGQPRPAASAAPRLSRPTVKKGR